MRFFVRASPGPEMKAIGKTVCPSQNVWNRHILFSP